MNSHKIIADAIGLSGRRAWSLLLSIATTYAVARFLGSEGYGLFALFMLIPSLGVVGIAGWDQVARRELAHLRGLGDKDSCRNIRNTAYLAEVALALCWAVVAVGVAWRFIDWPIRIGVLVGAAGIIITKLTQLCMVDAFLEKDFSLQVRVGVAVTTIGAGLKVMAAWLFGPAVTFGSLVLADGYGLWLYLRARPLRLRWHLDRSQLWRLTKIGMPLAALGLLSGPQGVMLYLERVILGSQTGLELLGLYVFAQSLSVYLVMFVGDCLVAYQPHLLEALATAPNRRAVYELMAKPSLAVAFLSAIGGAFLLALLPSFITLALPNYVSAIPLLPMVVAAAFLGCFYWLPAILLCSAFANQQGFCTKVWVIAVTMFGGALWVFVRWGWGAMGAAWASVIAALCVAVAFALRAYRYYIADWRAGLRHALARLIPPAYVMLTCIGARTFGSSVWGTGVRAIESHVILAGVTLILSVLPLLVVADRLFNLRTLFRPRVLPGVVSA